MEEKNLLKLALVVSLTGILILIFIIDTIEIKDYKIKDLTKKDLNKDVNLKGTITRITETPGLYIFNLDDQTGEITGIIFKEEQLNLTVNQKIEVQGTIIEYKNKLELEVDQLISID